MGDGGRTLAMVMRDGAHRINAFLDNMPSSTMLWGAVFLPIAVMIISINSIVETARNAVDQARVVDSGYELPPQWHLPSTVTITQQPLPGVSVTRRVPAEALSPLGSIERPENDRRS